MARPYPYTSDDLRAIADRIDTILAGLGENDLTDDADWRWGVGVRVGVEDEWVGEIKAYEDGWLGFYPNMKVTE